MAHPWIVPAAILAALAFFIAYRAVHRRRISQTLAYSNLAFLSGAIQPRAWPERVFAAAWVCAVALVALALAGPRVRASVPVGGSVVLCVDTSGSMSAMDVQPTRAQAALAALRAFVESTPESTAIGLVSFATNAQLLTPPTRDRDQLRAALDAIPAPNGATAIGDALELARRALPKTGHRIIVLITDGENNYGVDPLSVARTLGTQHIPLYTVGIGTSAGAFLPGTLQRVGIDEDALRAYAAAAGGAYSRADNAAQLREALATLGRTTTFARRTVDVSLATAIAGGALMALTLLAGLSAGRYP